MFLYNNHIDLVEDSVSYERVNDGFISVSDRAEDEDESNQRIDNDNRGYRYFNLVQITVERGSKD